MSACCHERQAVHLPGEPLDVERELPCAHPQCPAGVPGGDLIMQPMPPPQFGMVMGAIEMPDRVRFERVYLRLDPRQPRLWSWRRCP